MFCDKVKFIYYLNKWNLSNVIDMNGIYYKNYYQIS